MNWRVGYNVFAVRENGLIGQIHVNAEDKFDWVVMTEAQYERWCNKQTLSYIHKGTEDDIGRAKQVIEEKIYACSKGAFLPSL